MNPPLGVLDYPLITVGSAIISRTRGHLFYVTGAYPGTPEEVCALLNKAIAPVINTQTFVPINIEYYDPREDAHADILQACRDTRPQTITVPSGTYFYNTPN